MGARQADVRVWPKPPCFGQWFHSAIGSISGSRELQWLGTDCVGQIVTEGLCGTNCYRRAGGGKGTHYTNLVVSVPPRPTPSWSVACTTVHFCEPCCVSGPHGGGFAKTAHRKVTPMSTASSATIQMTTTPQNTFHPQGLNQAFTIQTNNFVCKHIYVT